MTFGRFKNENREVSVQNLVLTIIFWALSLAWILTIFLLSNVPSEELSELADSVLSQAFHSPKFHLDIGDTSIISMWGHMVEFGVLTIFAYFAISSTNKISVKTSYAESPIKILKSDNEMNIIFTLWFTILNAIFDEYHQLFISGHTGGVIDLCKDIIGIVVVLLLVRIIFSISLKVRGKKEIRYS